MSATAGLPGDAVSDAELCRELGDALAHRREEPVAVVRLTRHSSEYRSSYGLEELQVDLANGTALRLMFKDLSRGSMNPTARAAKPDFLHDPRREIDVYAQILEGAGLGTAQYHGSICAAQSQRYWLFIQKVAGVELYQVGDAAVWQQAACWLAGMHARFAGQAIALGKRVPLVRYDGDYYRGWLRRALAFLDNAEITIQERRQIRALADDYNRVVDFLLGLPITILHGDYYAANILIQPTDGGLRVCPVDWELAALGPALIDLAALTAGKWTPEEKQAMAMAYRLALPADSSVPTEPNDFLIALDHCRLQLAVQWLGWAPSWTPPATQQYDWLHEALTVAERLGILARETAEGNT